MFSGRAETEKGKLVGCRPETGWRLLFFHSPDTSRGVADVRLGEISG